jgi:hypothetical protein
VKFESIILVTAAFFAPATFAQVTPNPYALKMATQTSDALLPKLKPMMDAAFDKLEQDASQPGSPPSLKVFVQELRNSLNRENFISILTIQLQKYFNDEDFLELQKFEESRVGLKAAAFQADSDPNKMVVPLIAQACDRTLQRLKAISQPVDDSIKQVCTK